MVFLAINETFVKEKVKKATHRARVDAGPSRSRIIDALEYAFDKVNPMTVKFLLQPGVIIEVRVTSVINCRTKLRVSGDIISIGTIKYESGFRRFCNNHFVYSALDGLRVVIDLKDDGYGLVFARINSTRTYFLRKAGVYRRRNSAK